MAEFTPRFCWRAEKIDTPNDSLYTRNKTNLNLEKNYDECNLHQNEPAFDNIYTKSKTKSIFKEVVIPLTINKFFNEEFDPEKDYEQFHYKRFLLPKIKVFNGKNLEDEEL